MAATAEELNAQADQMRDLISYFRVGDKRSAEYLPSRTGGLVSAKGMRPPGSKRPPKANAERRHVAPLILNMETSQGGRDARDEEFDLY